MIEYVFFFFFQAEDGIRDLTVTGVQTCALPISTPGAPRRTWLADGDDALTDLLGRLQPRRIAIRKRRVRLGYWGRGPTALIVVPSGSVMSMNCPPFVPSLSGWMVNVTGIPGVSVRGRQ